MGSGSFLGPRAMETLPGCQGWPQNPSQEQDRPGGTGAAGANAPGFWHLPGDRDGPRPGQNIGLLMRLAWRVP